MESHSEARSSRRKPTKTHRISADIGCEQTSEFAMKDHISEATGGLSDSAPQSDYSNAELSEEATIEDDSSTVDSAAGTESLDLPEGTIVVQPEAVEDSMFDGPEFGSGANRQTAAAVAAAMESVPAIVHCTACNQRIDTSKCDVIFQHPTLKVLLCKRCHEALHKKRTVASTAFKQCTWCAAGVDLICCDFCTAMFCKVCIRRNFGRSTLDNILNADDGQKWHCFICNPMPLSDLVKSFTRLVASLDDPARLATAKTTSTESRKSAGTNNNGTAGSGSKLATTNIRPSNPSFSAAAWLGGSADFGTIPGLSSDMVVTEHNVWQVVEKLLAATQSMSMLLSSLNDDLRRSGAMLTPAGNAGPEGIRKRQEMATKLWRAFVAYRKSFSDIEKYTQTETSTSLQQMAANKMPSISVPSNVQPRNVAPVQKYVPPAQSQPAEVIELSDSDDDSKCEVVEPVEKKRRLTPTFDSATAEVNGSLKDSGADAAAANELSNAGSCSSSNSSMGSDLLGKKVEKSQDQELLKATNGVQ
jgi:hypothetical protein